MTDLYSCVEKFNIPTRARSILKHIVFRSFQSET